MTAARPDCLFCKIVSGQVAAHVVDDGAEALAFLDHRPVFIGHCLVVPKTHYETLSDLPAKDLGPLFTRVQRVATAVEKGLGADGTFVAANNRVSQSVPHFHVHVIPRKKKDGLRGFFWPRQKYESEEMAQSTVDLIRNALA